MPGVDDGASTEAESRSGVNALWAQGVRTIVATPHIDGSLTGRGVQLAARLAEIDLGWQRLVGLAREPYPQLVLRRGAEVALDTPEPDLTDARLRLAGTSFVLVEFPHMTVPPHSARVIQHIVAAGYTPIIAHPERYANMTSESRLPHEWRAAGALLQMNAGSLTGRYGADARTIAYTLLQRGLTDFMCSDFHARGRPATAGARQELIEMDAREHADLMMNVNPTRMLAGQAPIPVPPLATGRTLLQRVKRWLR
jgi:protein-tyrosine phosphatase